MTATPAAVAGARGGRSAGTLAQPAPCRLTVAHAKLAHAVANDLAVCVREHLQGSAGAQCRLKQTTTAWRVLPALPHHMQQPASAGRSTNVASRASSAAWRPPTGGIGRTHIIAHVSPGVVVIHHDDAVAVVGDPGWVDEHITLCKEAWPGMACRTGAYPAGQQNMHRQEPAGSAKQRSTATA